MDPELAMALSVSMEEDRARQERIGEMAVTTNEEENTRDDADTAAVANNEGGPMDVAAAAADLHG